MKKNFLLLMIAGSCLLGAGCKKEAKDVVDCLGESLLVHLKHTADAANSKKNNYQIEYIGDHTVKSVQWQFGDGNSETVNGTSVSHTYSAAGTFKVKAKVTLQAGSGTCSPQPEKDVVVN